MISTERGVAAKIQQATTTAAPIARIQVFDDLEAAEPYWRRLDCSGAVSTPYQRYEWVALWHRHVETLRGGTPFIAVGIDAAGEPLFLLPLTRARRGPVTVATFFGGKHSNFNFALWRREYASGLTVNDMSDLLYGIGSVSKSVDLLMLLNQPAEWKGLANPFALLPHQRAPSDGHRLRLGPSGKEVISRQFSKSMLSTLRKKECKLQKLSDYHFYRAETASEVGHLLDRFFAQKAKRFRVQGLLNVFAAPSVEAFIRDACISGLTGGRPLIELYALEGDGEMLALRGGVSDGRRFSCMFNSFTDGTHARQSPGLLLTAKVITDCEERGYDFFDLGIGEADYKNLICNETELVFDSFLPLTPVGRVAAMAAGSAYNIKDQIKRSPVIWATAQAARRFVNGLRYG
jgi:CelD/BcsL family acetyltransferase involved in cellulose biosynthesis